VGYKILELDPWLSSFEGDINLRMDRLDRLKSRLIPRGGGITGFANGHLYYGFFRDGENGYIYREWAPSAHQLWLIGDFNNWDRRATPLSKIDGETWEVRFTSERDLHGSLVKVVVKGDNGTRERVPLFIRRAVYDKAINGYNGQIWLPRKDFEWTDSAFDPAATEPPLIYEAHVGMATEEYRVGTYAEFAGRALPWIKDLGYNTVQLMAIAEHPYYGSFGYHVSNFFAPSSRFGTPEELKAMINTAHGMGIRVLMDIVHSHAVRNFDDGINEFDGTVWQFFHSGGKGEHPAWDSKVFDYGKPGVLHFLLSNVKYWLEEFHFDGFRCDGVTSMLYHHHGLGENFDNYSKYFSMATDLDAVNYLQLASELAKAVRPGAVMIAEDMSGMPGMCLPVEYGGIGFDYRLAMGMPDYFIRTLKERRDEDWDITKLWWELTTRRPGEKAVGYCESHDQALVGDKTIMFWLADQEMYWHMDAGGQSLAIDRAIALHKMIRFITLTAAGEGYLNFMGNEFGHPEWIDFPREGNGWNYHYARRQWSLAVNPNLRYKQLLDFDRAMIALAKAGRILERDCARLVYQNNDEKILSYVKGEYLFVFNFHPIASYPKLRIAMGERGAYAPVFTTDAPEFGGFGRVLTTGEYRTIDFNGADCLSLYVPARTAVALKKTR
jgi:1,4-alpha-glucan branching enzyme